MKDERLKLAEETAQRFLARVVDDERVTAATAAEGEDNT
jgi:hypothetical protein